MIMMMLTWNNVACNINNDNNENDDEDDDDDDDDDGDDYVNLMRKRQLGLPWDDGVQALAIHRLNAFDDDHNSII